jgi:hypothetical protein
VQNIFAGASRAEFDAVDESETGRVNERDSDLKFGQGISADNP